MFRSLRQIVKILRLRRPGMVFLVIRKDEIGMLKFVLVLPTAGAHDVVTREIDLQIGDGEVQRLEVSGDTLETIEFSGDQGTTVTGSLRDVDDVGNVSEPRDFTFTLEDTLAPPQPGEVGARVTEETPDTPVDPVDPTEPEEPSDL